LRPKSRLFKSLSTLFDDLELARNGSARFIDLMLGKPRRVYDAPDKGVLWGWEVLASIFTKAIATGTFLPGSKLFSYPAWPAR